jgi:hypothetical protein
LEILKRREADTRFGIHNGEGSIWVKVTDDVVGELAKYRTDLVGMQRIRWDKWSAE